MNFYRILGEPFLVDLIRIAVPPFLGLWQPGIDPGSRRANVLVTVMLDDVLANFEIKPVLDVSVIGPVNALFLPLLLLVEIHQFVLHHDIHHRVYYEDFATEMPKNIVLAVLHLDHSNA